MIAIIDWNEKAKKIPLSSDMHKEIYLYTDEMEFTGKKMSMNKANIKELWKKGVFVYDRTAGQEVSPDSIMIPDEQVLLGRLQFKRLE